MHEGTNTRRAVPMPQTRQELPAYAEALGLSRLQMELKECEAQWRRVCRKNGGADAISQAVCRHISGLTSGVVLSPDSEPVRLRAAVREARRRYRRARINYQTAALYVVSSECLDGIRAVEARTLEVVS